MDVSFVDRRQVRTSGSRWLGWIAAWVLVAVRLSAPSQAGAAPPPSEQTSTAPMPAEEAARSMVVPEGFQVELFAAEPQVQQPIGMCLDDRGRVWVAEAYSYPVHGLKPNDRIIVLSDTDGDGRADQRTVFFDQLNYVTGLEVGFGGVWVVSPPYFYFIPDRDGDAHPDGPPQVLLDGFGTHANAHNLANGLAWGPDGWLYGTHGRTNWSMLGKPGTPEDQRQRFDGGVYRYHPTRHVWEPYADGTTNPWGIDWNDLGEAFVTNCVNPHLFHVLYGAHYEPWRNRASSQYAYERLPTIADHLHFVGGGNVRAGLGSAAEDSAGGGHAHCGVLIYLGDTWPARYRNMLFTHNIHGRRINNDLLSRHGSSYVAAHGADLLRSRDAWYMGVTLCAAPDGSVYSSDWSDTGECHSTKNTQRQTGRIYNIRYQNTPRRPVNLAALDSDQLVELQLHANDWYVRHARRLLQERAAVGEDLSAAIARLKELWRQSADDVPRQLRVLWCLYCLGATDAQFLAAQLEHNSEYVRAWAVRLLCEPGDPPQSACHRLAAAAARDPSPLVRLHLASMLQRLSPSARWPIAQALLAHAEDADDHHLPLMVWYGVESLVESDPGRYLSLAAESRVPLVARFMARRAASLPAEQTQLAPLVGLLASTSPNAQLPATRVALLTGILEGLEGRRSVKMPETWPAASRALHRADRSDSNDELAALVIRLALVFDDPEALQTLQQQAGDRRVPATRRNLAINALVAKQVPGLSTVLLDCVEDSDTRGAAIRGLAEYDDSATPAALLKSYGTWDAAARQDALQTLASRPAWALQLMEAIQQNRVPRSDVTAYTARQLMSLKHPQLEAQLKAVWGTLRTTPREKEQQVAEFKKRLAPEVLQAADRSLGRAVFQKQCANCHRFFGSGGAIGPDITGSQRTNLDYLLQTLVDPSAAVAKDYQMQIVETTGGRVITGLVVGESPQALTLQTVNERIVVPVAEIDRREPSPLSIMPEGMLQSLSPEQVRSLVAYLMGPNQVELPAGVEPGPK